LRLALVYERLLLSLHLRHDPFPVRAIPGVREAWVRAYLGAF
jgi:hypothetical protein